MTGADGSTMETTHQHEGPPDLDEPARVASAEDPAPDLRPLTDPERLDHLVRFGLRTDPPVAALERLCRLASRMLGADAASVTIVEDVQTTVAMDRLDLPDDAVTVPLDESFCARAMVTRRPLSVPDAREHPWVQHTVAAREERVVGYLGAPLFLSDGNTLGALCVFSDEPRTWTEREERLLTDLAASAASELELRVAATDLAASLADTVAARDQLAYAATHDGLTDLANRRLLIEAIEEALEGLGDLALLYLDLDAFKPINDRFGHAVGDTLLITVADRLRTGVDPHAVVARLGGDEFAVLAPASSPTLARRLADDLHAALVHPMELDGHTVEIGASIGLVTASLLGGGRVDADVLLSAADAAMYEAKRDPEHPVRVFDAEIRARHERRTAVREAVRSALDEGRIEVTFEPDMLLATGALHGLQVAPQLLDSPLDHVGTDELVEATQELGRLGALARLVTDRLIAVTDAWREEGLTIPPRLWLLATGGQLSDVELQRRLVAISTRTGAAVGVQVPERALADESVVAALQALGEVGLSVAVERFGSGTASFASLRQIRPDLLRLDPRFVTDLEEEPTLQAAVSAFVQLADALDVAVAADGVGSGVALERVEELGCVTASGPLLARALPDGPGLRRLLQEDRPRGDDV